MARTWRKSSYSQATVNSNCVEVSWRKSSHSGAGVNSNCVEVAADTELVGVRDSKKVPGPTLNFPTATWRAFLDRAARH